MSEQAFDLDAQALVISDGVAQELDSAGDLLVGVHVGKADAGVIVYGHEQHLPAGALDVARRLPVTQ